MSRHAAAKAGFVFLPCREHGGVGDAAGCKRCIDAKPTTVEPPPPGETGTELHGIEAMLAIQKRLDAIPTPQVVNLPSLTRVRIVDLDVCKDGGRFAIAVKFWKQRQPVMLRVSAAWLKVLRGRIDRALES